MVIDSHHMSSLNAYPIKLPLVHQSCTHQKFCESSFIKTRLFCCQISHHTAYMPYYSGFTCITGILVALLEIILDFLTKFNVNHFGRQNYCLEQVFEVP